MTGGGVRQRTRGPTSHSNQQTLIQCPLCGRQFERSVVEIHAATCEGRDPDQVIFLLFRLGLLKLKVLK